MASSFLPRKIYVDKRIVSSPLTRRILKNCRNVPVEVLSDRRSFEEVLADSADPIGEGKRLLWLTRQKGAFVKACPCTPHYIGCNYFIINTVLNCPLDCSYCILQLYLSPPVTTIYVNRDDLWKELDTFLFRKKGKFLRLGTGELADSLALDPLTQTARELVDYFRKKPAACFELKTKTVNIDGILAVPPAENTVISWSLNSAAVARAEEKGAAPVAERLEAARRVAERGFSVGFHFDPLIDYPGWEEDYGRTIECLFRAVPAAKIRWISLGSLRFPPPLKPVIARRFPETKIIDEELVPGKDGKLRYFKPLRLEMYRRIVGLIRSSAGRRVPLYFCMEDAEVWGEVMDWRPRRKEDVELRLSPRSV